MISARRRAQFKRNSARCLAIRRAAVNAAKDVPCEDCGRRFPSVCMDFHHVRGRKLFTVGTGISSHGLKAVLNEIAKCVVVCANCHRLRTHRGQ